MEKPNAVIRILQLLKNRRKRAVFLVALVVVAVVFDIAVPLITQRLIDALIDFFRIGGAKPTRMLGFSALGILIATLANRVLASSYNYHLFTTVTQTEDRVKYKVIEKYLLLHTLFHHSASSGQMIGRIERGATAVYTILHDIIGHNLLQPLLIYAGVLGLLAFKNAWIALVVFLPLPIYLIAVWRLTRKIYEIEKQANDEFEAVSREAYDVAGNVLTVKKFSQEYAETMHQAGLQANARKTQYEAERLWALMENIQTLIATLGRLGVIVAAGLFVLSGSATVGELVLYVMLQNMAYNPLSQLSHVFPRMRRNMQRAERLFAVLDEPIQVTDAADAVVLHPLRRNIVFTNVSFRYAQSLPFTLQNISLTIPAKSTVALVGRSGSGKTTFINLLLRSFDPQEGSIAVDGIDLRQATQESLRGQIAVVPQEVDLFSRTIRQNISYGKPDVFGADVIEAAKVALAHGFIEKMEFGYDTVVGERGIKLSGGERQRIGIARAVLRNPAILILDEATSHLDTQSERLIQEATDTLMRDRTTFIIAHRLSTVLKADIILVFAEGRIEAMGTHEELLTRSSTYKKLYSLQFSE